VYGTTSDGRLVEIDTGTSSWAEVAQLQSPSLALAFHASSGWLYYVGNRNAGPVHRYHPGTGDHEPVGDADLGDAAGRAAFHPDGRLWVMTNGDGELLEDDVNDMAFPSGFSSVETLADLAGGGDMAVVTNGTRLITVSGGGRVVTYDITASPLSPLEAGVASGTSGTGLLTGIAQIDAGLVVADQDGAVHWLENTGMDWSLKPILSVDDTVTDLAPGC
jgi:hypothetical protein